MFAEPAAAADAPQVVWPESGRPIASLIADMKSTRERSRQSIDKLGSVDPRPLMFKHFRLGDLDLSQWWQLKAQATVSTSVRSATSRRRPGFPSVRCTDPNPAARSRWRDGACGKDLLAELRSFPESVLVIRGDELITADQTVATTT